MSKLELLSDATRGLDPLRKAAFEGYFIGSLSILVSDKDWNTALDTAKTCLEKFYPAQEAVPRG